MRRIISILGCGWLGTELGKNLMTKGYVVKGSTATAEKHIELETTGIQPFYVKIEPDKVDIDYFNFFNTDVLVITIPPKRMANIVDVFSKQIQQVIQLIRQLKIQKVLLVSSTSVYEPLNKEVHEGDEGNPATPGGQAMLKAENMLLEIDDFKTTIIRFGGLIGSNRNPGRFLAGKQNVPGNLPVNLIHRSDCVNIITQIIEEDIWGEVFNACSPDHPLKKDFYTKAAQISNMEVPGFTDKQEKFKIINSDKLIQRLKYKFIYPSPMDYLKEVQEWVYRI